MTMDRVDLRNFALDLRDIEDLCLLLNMVKSDALGSKAYSIHIRQITYYCNPRREGVVRYTTFVIPKKDGGERLISAPVAGLKSILYALNTILQSIYEPSNCAMGFVPGRSVVDNARAHMGQNYVYNIDLKDFFPSIDKSRVWKRLTLPPFNFSSDLADVIAGLCTMSTEEGNKARCVLPQGAPTSPTLSNIICEKLDRQLARLAQKHGLHYTRYADDITFSSMHYVYAKDGDFIRSLHKIIEQNRFTINDKKTRLQCRGERQEVTGIVLSNKLNVARKYTGELRTLLHIWERYGYMAARESCMRHRRRSPLYRYGHNKPYLESMIMGKLHYLKMVKGEKDAVYRRLYERFTILLSQIPSGREYGNCNIAYLQTMTREEFEQTLNTRLVYTPEQRYRLRFTVDNIDTPVSISRSVDIAQLFAKGDTTKQWESIRISLCENRNTQFYLLHKISASREHTTEVVRAEKTLMQVVEELAKSRLENPMHTEDAIFEKHGQTVELDDLNDILLSKAHIKAVTDLAEAFDTDIEVVKRVSVIR